MEVYTHTYCTNINNFAPEILYVSWVIVKFGIHINIATYTYIHGIVLYEEYCMCTVLFCNHP